jgi:hypothetical protein
MKLNKMEESKNLEQKINTSMWTNPVSYNERSYNKHRHTHNNKNRKENGTI